MSAPGRAPGVPRGAPLPLRPRIEICGGIATGKTTLARLLAQAPQAAGAALVLEDFQANPFWQRFYENPALYAPEKNLCFLAQHCGEIKPGLQAPMTLCDYAVVQDLAYASLCPQPGHLATMTHAFEHLYGALPPPALMIHLQATPEVQLARIRARGRAAEAGITTGYLADLNAALVNVLAAHPPGCPVHILRSDSVDFANDAERARAVSHSLWQLLD